MGFSSVALYDVQTVDSVAPGVPTITSVIQSSNKTIQVAVTLPILDADGSELSGMTRLVVATAIEVDGLSPFASLSMQDILALPGVVSVEVAVSAADAGAQKLVELPVLNLGGYQEIAAAVSDA
jgi:hypothetical protein